jgi:ribonuclease T2
MNKPTHRLCSLLMTGWLVTSLGLLSGQARAADVPGQFDYYLLSLSWSPEFCLGKGRSAPQDQCGTKRYGFVVHGLWPQYKIGYPQNCQATPDDVPEDIVRATLPIMPSTQLIEHEWDKHGKCSGLAVDQYFKLIETGFSQLHIPPALQNPQKPLRMRPGKLRKDFLAANPNLTADSAVVLCKGQMLSEVHLCLDKTLNATACAPDVVRDQCRKPTLLVPPVR